MPKRLEEAAAASRVWQPELKQDTETQSDIAAAPSSEASPHDKPEEPAYADGRGARCKTRRRSKLIDTNRSFCRWP